MWKIIIVILLIFFQYNILILQTLLCFQVLVALSFLSSGSHQKSISKDFNISISQKSVSRVIKLVVEGLNAVLDYWVVFPASTTQRQHIKEG